MSFQDGRRTTGAYAAQVQLARRVGPNVVRVTLAGEDLRRLPVRGYDHWVRLFLPRPDGSTDFAAVPEAFGVKGYLRYLSSTRATRPPFRSYTVRQARPEVGELDIDVVVHGEGLVGRWASSEPVGDRVVLIDQGRGFDPVPGVGRHLLVCEESGMPGVLGILRDLPREATGAALVEVPSDGDVQEVSAPAGVEVRWLPRGAASDRPGLAALEALRSLALDDVRDLRAYVVGEQRLAVEGRRHLVAAGVPRDRVVFMGFWRAAV